MCNLIYACLLHLSLNLLPSHFPYTSEVWMSAVMTPVIDNPHVLYLQFPRGMGRASKDTQRDKERYRHRWTRLRHTEAEPHTHTHTQFKF